MKVLYRSGLLILAPETDVERDELADWKSGREGHVFVAELRGDGAAVRDLGTRENVCREPINIGSKAIDSDIRLLSNFAPTPFELDGRMYACVESFWQGLKYDDQAQRDEIAEMDALAAKRAGDARGYGEAISYDGRRIVVGTCDHWELMEAACRAKFTQNDDARAALLGTGERPLTHKMRRDSRSIPGVVMADIWMRIRRELAGP